MLKKIASRPATTATRVLQTSKSRVELSKPEKVPEPCRSCGRNDLPERFHTHGPTQDHPGSGFGGHPQMTSQILCHAFVASFENSLTSSVTVTPLREYPCL